MKKTRQRERRRKKAGEKERWRETHSERKPGVRGQKGKRHNVHMQIDCWPLKKKVNM
uniref:Uncharacterized protein n=1 Tax=Daucus carota subsp. sativus TaxID=79200 RepID=A0A162A7N9_DAUCS